MVLDDTAGATYAGINSMDIARAATSICTMRLS